MADGLVPVALIGFLLAVQAPVVGPARRARMLAAGGHLRVIQGKLSFVGALDEHQVVLFPLSSFLSPLSRSVHSFRLASNRE